MLRVVRGSTSSTHCFHPLRTLEKLTSDVWLLLILFTMERASQETSGAKNLLFQATSDTASRPQLKVLGFNLFQSLDQHWWEGENPVSVFTLVEVRLCFSFQAQKRS